MAFINIKDPDRRKEIVQEYIRIRDSIRERNENNKESNLLKEREIEKQFRPIVQATEKSAERITSALEKEQHQHEQPPSTPFEFYSALSKKDKYFSIYRTNGGDFKLGDTDIQIDEENSIHILGKTFEYTTGLWDLLMLNNLNDVEYTEKDLEHYKEIVEITNLKENPHLALGGASRFRSTLKYKFLGGLQEVTEDREEKATVAGQGIILPGDIKRLKERFRLVCGERAAGNIKATTPEIVAILDEFLHRGVISKSEYNAVCGKLGC